MTLTFENGHLTVYLNGRVDSSNAEALDNYIAGVINDSKTVESILFDADKLEYISSAGLRVLLKYRKLCKNTSVVNAGSEVYEVLEMTGFTEMMPVEKSFRKLSVDGCEIIGQGAKGTVYRYDADTVVKVYKNPDALPDIKNERDLARKAFVLGIPTAISYDIVRVGNCYGSVFELLDAKSFSQLIVDDSDNRDEYIKIYAELLRQIHSTAVSKDDMPDIKQFVFEWLETDRPYIDNDIYDRIYNLISTVPDRMNMLHCDYHTNNVMLQHGEALLIDMDTLSYGHPIFELANIYTTYLGFALDDPAVVEKFLCMPADSASYVWHRFLSEYLDTDDKAYLDSVENKAALISYVRLMRHYVRKKNSDPDSSERMIKLTAGKITEIIDKIDTLNF